MKKTISIITSIGLLFTTPIYGQDDTADIESEEPAAPLPPPKHIDQSELQNWIFAGASLVAAAGAILLVAWNPGSPPPPGQATPP